MEELIGKVIRIDLDIYAVKTKENIVNAKARGNTKKKGNILVGDVVSLEKAGDDFMITSVRNRQNSLIRPPVSNIDQMIIVTSLASPVPDYILLDKQGVIIIPKVDNKILIINNNQILINNCLVNLNQEFLNIEIDYQIIMQLDKTYTYSFSSDERREIVLNTMINNCKYFMESMQDEKTYKKTK